MRVTVPIQRLFVNHHLRSAQVRHMFSRDLTALPAHPHAYPQSEWAIPAFAFPGIAGTHLPTPEGWKTELACLAGDVVRQFTYPKAFNHPTTNQAQRRATALIETNGLPPYVHGRYQSWLYRHTSDPNTWLKICQTLCTWLALGLGWAVHISLSSLMILRIQLT